MKTALMKLSSVILLLTLSFFALAADEGNVKANLNLGENQEVIIHLSGNTVQNLELKVFDKHGDLIMSKDLKNSGKQKHKHDISNFSDGIYTYQVIQGEQLIYSARVVKTDQTSLECRNRSCGNMASISETAPDQVLVRLTKDEKAKLIIKVSDERGNILFTRLVKNGKNLLLTHDISSFPKGNYIFSVYENHELIAYKRISK